MNRSVSWLTLAVIIAASRFAGAQTAPSGTSSAAAANTAAAPATAQTVEPSKATTEQTAAPPAVAQPAAGQAAVAAAGDKATSNICEQFKKDLKAERDVLNQAEAALNKRIEAYQAIQVRLTIMLGVLREVSRVAEAQASKEPAKATKPGDKPAVGADSLQAALQAAAKSADIAQVVRLLTGTLLAEASSSLDIAKTIGNVQETLDVLGSQLPKISKSQATLHQWNDDTSKIVAAAASDSACQTLATATTITQLSTVERDFPDTWDKADSADTLIKKQLALAGLSSKPELFAKAVRTGQPTDPWVKFDQKIGEYIHANVEDKLSAFPKLTLGSKASSDLTAMSSQKAETKASAPAANKEIELAHAKISYGLTASLLRYRVTRDPSRPGRERAYEPSLDVVPPQIGFQVTVSPDGSPMRTRSNGKPFQIMSVGGMVLTEPHLNDQNKRTSLTLAAVVSFLEDTIGFGIGLDMYRAIPIPDANGKSGSLFAHTGLLGWALSPRGELTAENLSFLVTLNATTLATLLSGSTNGAAK